jgi:hypothetical protein
MNFYFTAEMFTEKHHAVCFYKRSLRPLRLCGE